MVSGKRIYSASRLILFFTLLFLTLTFFHFCCAHEFCEIQNLGLFVHDESHDIVGLDGCASIQLSDNLMMWTFGDTIIGHFNKTVTSSSTFEDSAVMNHMLSNSIAFTELPSDKNIATLRFNFLRKDGKAVECIDRNSKLIQKNSRIWPTDGIKIGNEVYLYFINVAIEKGNTNGIPFRLIGTGIARWAITPKWTRGDPVLFIPQKILFNGNEPVFGDAVILHEGRIYLVGHKQHDSKVSGYIARVSPHEILQRDKYEFLRCDGEWVHDVMQSCQYFNDIAGEPSISYNSSLQKYILLYCSLQGSIKAVAFSDFSELSRINPLTVYTPQKLPYIKGRQTIFYYSGKEIFNSDKFLYAIYINPSIYQPTLLRIPYCIFDR